MLEGHTDEIFSAAFNYEGDTIITGSKDRPRPNPNPNPNPTPKLTPSPNRNLTVTLTLTRTTPAASGSADLLADLAARGARELAARFSRDPAEMRSDRTRGRRWCSG